MSEPDDAVGWQVACERAAILRRTFAGPDGRRDLTLAEAAGLLGIDRSTLYRWRRRYRIDERVSALLPYPKGRRRGARILAPGLEALVERIIETFYLSSEAPSLAVVVRRVQAEAHAAGMGNPAWRTVRRRIEAIDIRERLRRREGAAVAAASCEKVVGHYGISEPLAVVQLDHTVVDVIVVDDLNRRPVGRPVATFAIDVATRMVTGFYLGFDEPSVLRAGVCLSQSVFEKEAWLTARGISLPWPVSGLPRAVHVDNAGEFHASAFTRTLQDHGIQIIYRPLGKPRFGGHVERLIGTQMGAVHLLPGTTFSNTIAKGAYPSEGRAAMTLGELERWMLLEILGVYHQRIHAGLSRPPIAVWDERTRGLALPLPKNRMAFFVGLMPMERRMVRRDGVRLFGIHYWSDALGDLPGRSHARLEVRYDPRDLSRIYVRRPQGQFVEAPYRDLGRARICLWEHRRAVGRLRAQGRAELNETLIFETIEAQRALEDAARCSAKEARRQIVRRPRGVARPPERSRSQIGAIDTDDPSLRVFDVEVIHDKQRG